MSEKIGLFYGSNTDNTRISAGIVKEELAKLTKTPVEVIDIGESDLEKLRSYTRLVVGCPTWNVGELQDDWNLAFPKLDEITFKPGTKIAIFGVGDQFGYSDNYCDAIGILGYKFEERGAELVGYTSTAGYEFSNSRGVVDGAFLGLALDDDNQSARTPERIADWVDLLIYEFELPEAQGA